MGDELNAGAPFYGAAARTEKVGNIKAALLVHYAEDDPRVNAMRADFEAAGHLSAPVEGSSEDPGEEREPRPRLRARSHGPNRFRQRQNHRKVATQSHRSKGPRAP